jgi:hypothetical protein
MTTDQQMVRLLEAVLDGDFADRPVDNELLADALRLSLASVASHLQEANARSLLSGTRAARRPGPWYTNLAVSSQGHRFLASRGTDGERNG